MIFIVRSSRFCVCVVLTVAISFCHVDASDDEDTEDGGGGGEEDELVDGMAPTPKRRKLARQDALRKAKSTEWEISRVQGCCR